MCKKIEWSTCPCCYSHCLLFYFYCILDFAVQAQYHSDMAREMMMSSVQASGSDSDKADIMEVLINIYYILGRALTQLKKYVSVGYI